jgi:hypothetical protein
MIVARAPYPTRVLVLGPVLVLGHVPGRHVGRAADADRCATRPGRPVPATVLPHRAHRLPRPAGPSSAHVPPHPARRVPRAASQNHHGGLRPPGWNGRVPRHRTEAAPFPSRRRGSRHGLDRRCPNRPLRGLKHLRGPHSHRSAPSRHHRGPNPHHRDPKHLRGPHSHRSAPNRHHRGPNSHRSGPNWRPRGPAARRPGRSHQGCRWSRCA